LFSLAIGEVCSDVRGLGRLKHPNKRGRHGPIDATGPGFGQAELTAPDSEKGNKPKGQVPSS
jgi:hypothetical protein